MIRGDELMEDRTWGLVLAGGGGKGAYQVGVIKALVEQGWQEKIVGISGSSIGSLNAVLFAQGDMEKMEAIWNAVRPENVLDVDLSSANLRQDLEEKYVVMKEFLASVSLDEYLKKAAREGICSRAGLEDIIRYKLDLEKVRNSKRKIYATVAYMKDNLPTAKYCLLNSKSDEEITNILLASSALPVIYDAVEIDGISYRDGGIVDNVPCKPLLEDYIENLIVVRLKEGIVQPSAFQQGKGYQLELRPSHNLGDFLSGTINFEHESIVYRIALGYYDTLCTLNELALVNKGTPSKPLDYKMQMLENHNRAMDASRRNRLTEQVNEHLEMFKKYENYYET